MSSTSSLLESSSTWWLAAGGSFLFASGILAGRVLSKKKAVIIRSPRTTILPKLTDEEKSDLPYPPDVFPGARDVDTPYGSIRAYEFGPEDGRKVLFIHGISTPCVSLGVVAHALVKKGCRVMLFDLFGRGYSDTPDDLSQDIRLFTTQILLVLASSPLSWTGKDSGKFSLVGYSLGGGVGASFASYFPDLLDTLILIAPAGLLRPHHISKTSHIIYSEEIIPESLLQSIVRKRLRRPMSAPLPAADDKDAKLDVTDAMQAEVTIEANSTAVLSQSRPHVTNEKCVADQLDNHMGFVGAFMSSIRYAPIRDQHERWQMVGAQLSKTNKKKGSQKKVLVVLGAKDSIIVKQEIQEDAAAALSGNVEFAVFDDAAHDVPIVKGSQVAEKIVDFWRRTD